MSVKGILRIDGKEFYVLSCTYSLTQEVDEKGLPSSIIKIGRIEIEIESTEDTSFFEWICNSFLRKDGSIIFSKLDSDATLKEVRFRNAYIVDYKECFGAASENPMSEQIVLSVEEIRLGNGSYQTEWS
jgi:hypothetical protein